MAAKNLLAFFSVSNGIIICHRELFEKVGGFDTSLDYGEDGDFIRKCKKFAEFKVAPAEVRTSMRRYRTWGILPMVNFCIDHYIFRKNKKYAAVR